MPVLLSAAFGSPVESKVMIEERDVGDNWQVSAEHIEHSAFPRSLPSLEVLTRFWTELKKILPADELHVIDPYALDAGGADLANYAGQVTSLLTPALRVVRNVVVIHGKPREGIRDHLAQHIAKQIALLNAETEVQFQKGSEMHGRYLVADRARALRMDFSFNSIGKSFGTVSVVDDAEDLAGVVNELERLHPAAVTRSD